MKAVDASVAVAAFGDWHRLNGAARAVLDRGATIPAHALLETYSVLTEFPPGVPGSSADSRGLARAPIQRGHRAT
jgi:hypothetical protein